MPARRGLTAGLVLTITLVAFESLAIATVMPVVSDDLGGLGLYGWVFSGFFLGNLLGIVLAGEAADRRGTRAPFLTGLVLFAIGLVVGGSAQSMPLLVAGRVAQGVGAGVIPAVAYASVGRAYPPILRPRVFAVFSTAWVVPGVVGPAAASAIERWSSWRVVFLALLPLVAVAALMTLPTLTQAAPVGAAPRPEGTRRRDAMVLVAGVALVLAGLGAQQISAAAALVVVGATPAAWAFLRLGATGAGGPRVRTGGHGDRRPAGGGRLLRAGRAGRRRLDRGGPGHGTRVRPHLGDGARQRRAWPGGERQCVDAAHRHVGRVAGHGAGRGLRRAGRRARLGDIQLAEPGLRRHPGRGRRWRAGRPASPEAASPTAPRRRGRLIRRQALGVSLRPSLAMRYSS